MRSSTMDVGARWTDGTARWRTMDLEAMDRHLNQQRTTFDNPLRASLYGFVLQQIRKAVRRPSHRYRDPRRCHRESVLSSTPTSNPIHSTIARAQSAWVSGQLIHNPVATPYAGRTVRRAVYDLHPQSSAYGMSELVESYKCARSKSPRARSLCGSPPLGPHRRGPYAFSNFAAAAGCSQRQSTPPRCRSSTRSVSSSLWGSIKREA